MATSSEPSRADPGDGAREHGSEPTPGGASAAADAESTGGASRSGLRAAIPSFLLRDFLRDFLVRAVLPPGRWQGV